MLTTIVFILAVFGLMFTFEYRNRYEHDGSGCWQLILIAAVTTCLVMQSIFLNY